MLLFFEFSDLQLIAIHHSVDHIYHILKITSKKSSQLGFQLGRFLAFKIY